MVGVTTTGTDPAVVSGMPGGRTEISGTGSTAQGSWCQMSGTNTKENGIILEQALKQVFIR